MQEPPANGEEQFPACPYCGSALVAGEAHDCDEVGDANTLSVGVLGKNGLPARNFAAESNPKPTPTQIHNPPEAPARSTSSDEIHGLIIDGRYEVLEKASQGGMGTVYKARHATLRHLLAVKILRKPKDEVSRRRFLQEAQLLSQIKHPNIVQVIDFGELTDGKSYLAMEYLSGPTLTAAVREGHMTPQRACRIGAQIARGMHHVHELGIVHRDLFEIPMPCFASFTRNDSNGETDRPSVNGRLTHRVEHRKL